MSRGRAPPPAPARRGVADAELIELARAALPDVALDVPAFTRFLGERLAAARDAGLPHARDLLLAFACGRGDAKAIAVLEAELFTQVPEYLSRLKLPREQHDEVRQALREKLLVAKGAQPPAITEYSGRGPLGAWLRVTAIRLALDLSRRSTGDGVEPGVGLPAGTSPADPELQLIRAQYEGEFNRAIASAVAGLGPDHRRALRLHFLDGVPVHGIAALLRVHRTTVTRWLLHARQVVLEETRRRVGERLGLRPSELDSALRLLQSQLDVSIERYLRDHAG